MVAVPAGKILVTGANGYIAVWILKQLLEQNYSVRGTVRNLSRSTFLKNQFAQYGDKLEIVAVPDITKDGAFDEAVKGVDGILHMASPFRFDVLDPADIIDPAVAGTKSIMESTRKFGTGVRRLVLTSSVASILNTLDHPQVFDESSWNDTAVEECEKKGKDASPAAKYRASKTLAERAAWEFMDKHKGSLSFDMVAICPPYVYGPLLHDIDKPEHLGASMIDWYFTVLKGKKDKAALVSELDGTGWADVRDIARGHLLGLQTPEASGQRFLLNAGHYLWQDWVSAAHAIDPSIPAGNTNYDPTKAVYWIGYDSSRAGKVLGMKYISMEQSTRDILTQFKAKGWY